MLKKKYEFFLKEKEKKNSGFLSFFRKESHELDNFFESIKINNHNQ